MNNVYIGKETYHRAIDQPVFWEPSLAFLKYAIASILAGSAGTLIAVVLLVPDQFARAANTVIPAVVAATAWFYLARGRIEAAVRILAIGLWSTLTYVAFYYGGVTSTIIIIYPMIILMCGWLIGTRTALVVALMTIAATLSFVLAESAGVLPAPPVTPPALRWVIQSMVFLFSVFLIVYVVRSYKERLAQVQMLGDQLALRSKELAERETELHRAQAVAHVGSWVYDLGTDTIRLSAETCRIFGLPSGTVGSQSSYLSRVHKDDRAAVDQMWHAALAGSASFDIEHRIVVGESIRWVRQIAELDDDANGAPLRATGTTEDITESRQAEETRRMLEAQLRESQKLEALGTLAGGIAHDFNNILAAIIGNAEIARVEIGSGHLALKNLDEIGQASRRGRDLVQQILIYCRRQVLARSEISLAPIVLESARLLRVTLPPGVRLNVDCAAPLPTILADATQMQQVLLNLCQNAAQAIREAGRNGTIDVRLTVHEVDGRPFSGPDRRKQGKRAVLAAGRYVCLSVRDDGPGMDNAMQARMFEPFYSTKPAGQGTGLGLSVVQGIAQAHDAQIEVQSALGNGCTFRIYFPAIDVPATAQEPDPDPVRDPGTPVSQDDNGWILFVDDDESIVRMVKRLLERKGHRVSGHTDAEKALAAFSAERRKFAVAVTDYNMPGMSGLDFARALHGIRADLPVAIVSGYVTEELQAMAPAAGISELIFKVNIDELCAAVDRMVAQSRR